MLRKNQVLLGTMVREKRKSPGPGSLCFLKQCVFIIVDMYFDLKIVGFLQN